jgi:peptide deformylase
MVSRPLVLHVEHQAVDGERHITIFEKGLARLVAHEIDHLYGTLYTERICPGAALIPVSEYNGTGERWQYSNRPR